MTASAKSIVWSRPTWMSALLGEPVVCALILGFLSLVLWDATQAGTSLGFTLEALLSIAPYFLLAIGFAGWAKASGADALIARAFTGNPFATIVAASLVGALSPFCSCGVIPLIAAMLAAGVPLAPVMAFCIASPIMDPEMFILTAAGISPEFAVAKTVATFAMGLLSGFGVLAVQSLGFLHEPLKDSARGAGCGASFNPARQAVVAWRFWRDAERLSVFSEELRTVGWFLGKWLALAFFLESLMVAYVPESWISGLVGGERWFAIPLATVVGIPSYLNGYAAIPLVSGLLDMGMSPGAAMAFITSGAVSSIPAAIAVYALVRRPVFVSYLGFGLIGSMLAGYGYDLYLHPF